MPHKPFLQVFNIFGVLSLVTTLSSLAFTPNTQAQSQVRSSSSSTALSLSTPALPPMPTEDPKVNLITVNCTPETCTTNGQLDWSKAVISNNKQYADYTCSGNGSFLSSNVLGIDDYKDGISLKTFKGYPDIAAAKNNYAAKRMACSYMNEKAGNIDGCNHTFVSVESYEDSQRPKLAVCSIPSGSFTGKNSPVFAYQFRYNIKFTEAEKTQKSDLYRSMTEMDGVYDRVAMTYTYYTYQKDGQWSTWENPNKDNVHGGWLVYGLSARTDSCDNSGSIMSVLSSLISVNTYACSPVIANLLSTKIQSGQSAMSRATNSEIYNYTNLTYEPNTQTLAWEGKYYPKVGCGATASSFVESNVYGYNLVLSETPKVQPDGVMCALAIMDVNFKGSQKIDLSEDVLASFDKLFTFTHRINNSQSSRITSSNFSSQDSSIQNSSQPSVVSNFIVVGKSSISDKDMLAILDYEENSKTLNWNVDLAANSGCDKVEKSSVINENGKLIIVIQKVVIPANTACTAIYGEYRYTNSEISDIDPNTIKNAITNKNFEVRLS